MKKMKTRYYVLVVYGDVEPGLSRPFSTKEARDKKAKELKNEHGDENGIYWLDQTAKGLKTGAYSGGFFKDITAKIDNDAMYCRECGIESENLNDDDLCPDCEEDDGSDPLEGNQG
jgi:rubrerythrin